MRTDDGREILLTLATPLPLTLLADLLQAVEEGARRAGYTDVVLMTDGSMRVTARRTPYALFSGADRAGVVGALTCPCEHYEPAPDGLCAHPDCGHDGHQHAAEHGPHKSCKAQEGDEPGCYLPGEGGPS